MSVDVESRVKNKRPEILFVDDEIEAVRPLLDILSSEYLITTATSGSEALRYAKSRRFDLIISDVMMPNMGGYDLLRALRETALTSNVPLMFVTGQDDVDSQIRGLELGAIDYIAKPIQVAVMIARIKTHLAQSLRCSQLQQMTYVDALTRLPNRRHFDEICQREGQRAARDRRPLAVLMIDIDEFKRFNDYYGHSVGDDCLRAVGSALKSCQRRPGDTVCRWGGEEFVAVLTDTDIGGASYIAKQMVEAVERMSILHAPDASHEFVTTSIGVASAHVADDRALKRMMEIADQFLYDAKLSGRNRVCAGEIDIAS